MMSVNKILDKTRISLTHWSSTNYSRWRKRIGRRSWAVYLYSLLGRDTAQNEYMNKASSGELMEKNPLIGWNYTDGRRNSEALPSFPAHACSDREPRIYSGNGSKQGVFIQALKRLTISWWVSPR
jgi:hypothetical protein